MKPCETSDERPEEYDGHYIWCATHNLPADCVATNGDDPVCEVYARVAGCNNKREYYRRGEMDLAEIIEIEMSHMDYSETTAKVLRALRKEARRQLDKMGRLEHAYHHLLSAVED